jgi:predicted patatin/cPLA2 family phospholipase
VASYKNSSRQGCPVSTLYEYLNEARDLPRAEKPGVVVQGGGMRGIYSVAALAVLEEMGLRDSFSVVVGSSAGALNGAYFVAGQAEEGIYMYADDLSNRQFVSLARPQKIVDIDFLVDDVMKQRHPMNVAAYEQAPLTLYTVLTNAETGQPALIKGDGGFDFYELMRASAALPMLYNKQVQLSSDRYIDGGFIDSVPLIAARSLGAELNLVLLTREAGFRQLNHGPAYKGIGRLLARGQSDTVKRAIGQRDNGFNTVMDEVEHEQEAVPRVTWTLSPSDVNRLVSRTTSDRRKLIDCANMARDDMRRLLNNEMY